MISKKIEKMLNEQILRELFSVNQYLSISSYFLDLELDGFANFFRMQAEEENFHAMKQFDYIHQVDGKVEIGAVKAPQAKFNSIKEAFKVSLEHEQFITKCIHDIVKAAIEENDYATHTFLQWFITEQVEEESLIRNILRKLDMVGDNSSALYLLDAELGRRKAEIAPGIMEFKIGEKVRFLHENLEGVILEIRGKKLQVLVDDFDDYEVSMDEVVKIHRGERNLSPRNPVAEPKESERAVKVPQMVQTPALALCTTTESHYELWLLNPSELILHFTCFIRIRNNYIPLNSGEAHPDEPVFLGKISTDQYYHLRHILLQGIWYSSEPKFNPREFLNAKVAVRMLNLDRIPEPIPELKRSGFLYPLAASAEIKEETPAPKEFAFKNVKITLEPPPDQVDLHIDKLVDNSKGMRSDVMFRIQMEHFHQMLGRAVANNIPKIIFIHGVGKHFLKQRIHEELEAHPQVDSFGLADAITYGEGATEVKFII